MKGLPDDRARWSSADPTACGNLHINGPGLRPTRVALAEERQTEALMFKNARTALWYLSIALAGSVVAYATEISASVTNVAYCLACGG